VPLKRKRRGVIERPADLAPAAGPCIQPPSRCKTANVVQPRNRRHGRQLSKAVCSQVNLETQGPADLEQTQRLKIKGAELLLSRWG